MTEYEVLGLPFKDFPLKEAVEYYRELMKQPGIHLASMLSFDEIVQIVENPQCREWFDSFEFVINQSFDNEDSSRAKSSEKAQDLLDTILRSIMASGEGVFLLCDTAEHLELLKFILARYSTLAENDFEIVGEAVYDRVKKDTIYNSINVECPKIILSTMNFDMQGHVMMEGNKILNASLWLGLIPSALENIKKGHKIWHMGIKQQLDIKKRIGRYNKRNKGFV